MSADTERSEGLANQPDHSWAEADRLGDASHMFGRWAVQEQIGSGGNSLVYRVRAAEDEIDFALKLLTSDEGADDRSIRKRNRFANEIATSRKAKEDGVRHVIEIVDSGEEADGRMWYVMPLADSTIPLGLPPADAIHYGFQISNIAADLHDAGIAHRDIKPYNCLLFDGEVVLADFGIVLDQSRENRDTVFNEEVRSRAYGDPEARGGNEYNPFAADSFSIAKTVWALIAGEDQDEGELLDRHSLESRDIEFVRIAQLDQLLADITTRGGHVSGRLSARETARALSLLRETEQAGTRKDDTGRQRALERSRRVLNSAQDGNDSNARKNHAVNRFWSTARDAGRRIHEDVFAPMGYIRGANFLTSGILSQEDKARFLSEEGWDVRAPHQMSVGQDVRTAIATYWKFARGGSEVAVHVEWVVVASSDMAIYERAAASKFTGNTQAVLLDQLCQDIDEWVDHPDQINRLIEAVKKVRKRSVN